MPESLAGRRVIVTGGGSGVGADMARGFAAAGAEVVIAGRRREALDAVAASLGGVRAIECDVTDERAVEQLFADAGPTDIVVANAGAADSAPFTRTSLDLWQQMVAVNLTGVFLTLREGLRQLRGAKWGRLIVVASSSGLQGYPYVSAYTAAKHGAVGLTRSVAAEVAGSGITANALCPGYIDTEMTVRTISNIVDKTGMSVAGAVAAITGSNAEGRLLHPFEITAAALRLCGPGSDAMNGLAIEEFAS